MSFQQTNMTAQPQGYAAPAIQQQTMGYGAPQPQGMQGAQTQGAVEEIDIMQGFTLGDAAPAPAPMEDVVLPDGGPYSYQIMAAEIRQMPATARITTPHKAISLRLRVTADDGQSTTVWADIRLISSLMSVLQGFLISSGVAAPGESVPGMAAVVPTLAGRTGQCTLGHYTTGSGKTRNRIKSWCPPVTQQQ